MLFEFSKISCVYTFGCYIDWIIDDSCAESRKNSNQGIRQYSGYAFGLLVYDSDNNNIIRFGIGHFVRNIHGFRRILLYAVRQGFFGR